MEFVMFSWLTALRSVKYEKSGKISSFLKYLSKYKEASNQ